MCLARRLSLPRLYPTLPGAHADLAPARAKVHVCPSCPSSVCCSLPTPPPSISTSHPLLFRALHPQTRPPTPLVPAVLCVVLAKPRLGPQSCASTATFSLKVLYLADLPRLGVLLPPLLGLGSLTAFFLCRRGGGCG